MTLILEKLALLNICFQDALNGVAPPPPPPPPPGPRYYSLQTDRLEQARKRPKVKLVLVNCSLTVNIKLLKDDR